MVMAAAGLNARSGILVPKKFNNSTMCMVLQQLESLIHACGSMRLCCSDLNQEVVPLAGDVLHAKPQGLRRSPSSINRLD